MDDDETRRPCLPSLRMRRPGHRPAHRRRLSPPGQARSRQLVCDPRTPARPRRAAPPDPPRRLPHPAGRPPGTRQAGHAWPRRQRGDHHGPVAGALAGLPHLPGVVDRPRLRRARAPVPAAAPRPDPAGRADHRARAGHVHRDHPPAPGHRPPGDGGDAGPDPCHLARRAEHRDPPRPDHRQPGPPRRTATGPPPARRRVDRQPDRALARHRRAATRRGVDRRADRPVPARHPR